MRTVRSSSRSREVFTRHSPLGPAPPPDQAHHWDQAPPDHVPPPGTRHPIRTRNTPFPWPGTLPLWTEWQTGVNILPCPKLHLWAVNIYRRYLPVVYFWNMCAVELPTTISDMYLWISGLNPSRWPVDNRINNETNWVTKLSSLSTDHVITCQSCNILESLHYDLSYHLLKIDNFYHNRHNYYIMLHWSIITSTFLFIALGLSIKYTPNHTLCLCSIQATQSLSHLAGDINTKQMWLQ